MAKRKKSIKLYQDYEDNIFSSLYHIKPITPTQETAFSYSSQNYNLVLHGIAGTGKTFLACYFSLKELMDPKTKINNIVIIRSVVPTRPVGYLPGNLSEKIAVYEAPYETIFYELLNKFESYENLKERNMLNFSTTSFIRGISYDNCIVIVDECQNMNLHELDSIITRLGKNSKIIFSGDFMQSDFRNINEKNGIKDFMTILDAMDSFKIVEFTLHDIVRSSLVKEYIVAKTKLAYC